jgi:hypothetical protein
MTDPDLELRYTHAFDIRINFDRRWVFGPQSGGYKAAYTSIGAGGTVTGPLLTGRVVDFSGADWPIVRPDGVVDLNAHYVIEATDGTLIYLRNQGYVHGPIRASAAAGGGLVEPYFRCTPYFRVQEGPHEWLNRSVLVGVGKRMPKRPDTDEPDHSIFRYYLIQ